jgi:hypothetical protein
MCVLITSVKEQDFDVVLKMLRKPLIVARRRLAFHSQHVAIQQISVLSAVRSFELSDEQPDRRVILGLEDPIFNGRVDNAERSPELGTSIDTALVQKL